MLTIIIAIFVVLLAALFVFAATRPDTFLIQRTATIKAPPENIFVLIDDLHSWGAWSPWEKIDPALKRTHSGVPKGKGAVYEWQGNNKVGVGRMEIMESSPPTRIVIKLDFFKPFEAHNTAEFTLQAKGDTTDVTWAMYGPSPYISKLMGLLCRMDSMVGKQFETGLANLKAITEK